MEPAGAAHDRYSGRDRVGRNRAIGAEQLAVGLQLLWACLGKTDKCRPLIADEAHKQSFRASGAVPADAVSTGVPVEPAPVGLIRRDGLSIRAPSARIECAQVSCGAQRLRTPSASDHFACVTSRLRVRRNETNPPNAAAPMAAAPPARSPALTVTM